MISFSLHLCSPFVDSNIAFHSKSLCNRFNCVSISSANLPCVCCCKLQSLTALGECKMNGKAVIINRTRLLKYHLQVDRVYSKRFVCIEAHKFIQYFSSTGRILLLVLLRLQKYNKLGEHWEQKQI